MQGVVKLTPREEVVAKRKKTTARKSARKKTTVAKTNILAGLKRAIEGRDGRTLANFYDGNAVLLIIDRDNPPSRPREIRGRAAIAAYHDDVCGRDMTHRVKSAVAEGARVAFIQDCLYPDGTKVCCATVAELGGGKITRQTVVQAWDG